MNNLKIAKKFMVTFGIIMIIFVIVTSYALVTLDRSVVSFTDFYENAYQMASKTYDIRVQLQAASKNLSSAIMSDDDEAVKMYIGNTNQRIENLNTNLEYVIENSEIEEVVAGSKEILEQVAGLTPTIDRLIALSAGMENEAAIELFFTEYDSEAFNIEEKVIAIYDITAEYADGVFNTSNEAIRLSLLILFSLTIVTVIFIILIGIYMAKRLVNPIAQIEAAARKIEAGDLDALITYQSKDELGALSNCMMGLVQTLKSIIGDVNYYLGEMSNGNFCVESKVEGKYVGEYQQILNSMRTINLNLSQTLSQINQASEQVASGSDQVSSGAQALSQGATEQASAVEELSATIAEISEQIKETATNAQQATKLSKEAGAGVVQSNDKMTEMISAMNNISDKSTEIGKIIKTIDDIAFQTNILALNAAVEAARAGSAGKGFAVVADEVRNLAQKSAEAAKNTTDLIQDTIAAVGNGTRIAGETAKSLESVVEKTDLVAENIQKISAASNEQASAAFQITSGIDQISSVVQTNSATAQQSAASSEELSGLAQVLKSLVSKFRLKNANNFGGSADLDMDMDFSEEDLLEQVLTSSSRPSAASNSKY